jgi:prepilin-type N-terminal cleavage/methylation domain-containing protein
MKRNGFTLLELLVVMAIIGILVAITVSILARARAQRQILQAQKQVKEIAAAASAYYDQLGSYPPDTGSFGTGVIPDTVNDPAAIYLFLGSKITDKRSGKEYGPYLDVRPAQLVGKLYVDPWGNAYQMDAFHVQALDVTQGIFQRVGEPYMPGVPEKEIRDVKVWSFGPDKNGGAGSAAPSPRIGADEDNITSWD